MRVTGPLLKVLGYMLRDPKAEVYGLELSRATRLKSGTLYPLLDRMEQAGWVTSRWERVDPAEESRPRRRFYKLTSTGAHEGRYILADYGVGNAAWT